MPSSSNNNKLAVIDWKAPTCEPGKCRSNCRRNPNCFTNLGEKFWFNTIKESFWVKEEDPETERKIENGHVGLKNLGATCYVNTFLQLWFTNKPLRSAVYRWHNDIPPTEIVNESEEGASKTITLSFGDDSTKAICGNLQFLFSLLQYSDRRYVDPSPFLESLGIEPNEQQDAQEFNKLFISLLDSSLLAQGINIIDQQFGGTYCYRTKCQHCHAVSDRPSTFYELDLNIKGHSTLHKCLKDFLKDEVLDGDNQYFCCHCQCKRDATRKIVLQKLPKTLNLQLLRFVFDRQTFTKKKLNNSVSFPDTLDMNDCVELENKEDGIYKLNAVLIHRGLSANSGHYIAHIWDEEQGVWSRFNDEEVEEMKSKTLELGKEDDLEGIENKKEKKEKKSEKEPGHQSKNSYMLVYVKNGEESPSSINPPENMLEIVAKDNSFFDEWVDTVKSKRNEKLSIGSERQKEVQGLFSRLPVRENDSDYDWISTKWLRRWLSTDDEPVPPIDNTELMCIHSCVDPSKLNLLKRVSGTTADDLFNKYGGLPRFKSEALCKKCEEFLKRKKEFFNKLTDDLKIFAKCSKTTYKVDSAKCYWVGKKTLKQMKQLATKEFMDSYGMSNSAATPTSTPTTSSSRTPVQKTDDDVNDKNNNDSQDRTLDENSSLNLSNNNSSSKKVKTLSQHLVAFNEDIVCLDHGNLNLQSSSRILISEEDWARCLEYFPSTTSFASDTPMCIECINIQKSNEEFKEVEKMQALEQRDCLPFLFESQNDRTAKLQTMDNGTFHVIPMSFIQNWRRKIKYNKLLEEEIDNSEMICEHDLSLYSAEEIVDEVYKDEPEITFIDEGEQNKLKTFFKYQQPVTVSMIKSSTTNGNGQTVYETFYESQPTYCKECRSLRLAEEAFDMKSYENQPIYVQKLTEKEQHNYTVDESKKNTDDEAIDELVEISVTGSKAFLKHQKREFSEAAEFVPNKKFKNDTSENARRSSRHRRKRGEYIVHVNSTHTLKQLKVQLLTLFSVFPLEQVLTFPNGYVLTEDDKELGELGVEPHMHLYLSVAQPDKDSIDTVPPGKERTLESGFKGTNLVSVGK